MSFVANQIKLNFLFNNPTIGQLHPMN